MDSANTHDARISLTHHDLVRGEALEYAPWPGILDAIAPQVVLEFFVRQIPMKPDTVCRALSRVREKLRESIHLSMNRKGQAHA